MAPPFELRILTNAGRTVVLPTMGRVPAHRGGVWGRSSTAATLSYASKRLNAKYPDTRADAVVTDWSRCLTAAAVVYVRGDDELPGAPTQQSTIQGQRACAIAAAKGLRAPASLSEVVFISPPCSYPRTPWLPRHALSCFGYSISYSFGAHARSNRGLPSLPSTAAHVYLYLPVRPHPTPPSIHSTTAPPLRIRISGHARTEVYICRTRTDLWHAHSASHFPT